jgi:aminoglycoside phosphotransferase (APT) family kinase protein
MPREGGRRRSIIARMHDDWIDRPAAPREGEALDADALGAYLERELGVEGPIEVAQFPRGFSNLTYSVRCADRDLILRRPPFGATVGSAHDMGREHRILSRLAPIYAKAPAPVVYCEDLAVLGAPFYLMERVRGVILRAGMPTEMNPAPELMADIAASWVETLAELHSLDYQRAGLSDLGRPRGYVRRQVEGWSERYRRSATDHVPAVERAATWLADHLPGETRASLVHNDFKYDNVVLDAGDWSRIVAVLDWEMATIGDPLMDLGTSLGYWVDPDDPPALKDLRLSPTDLPGNPGRSEIAALYAAASGRDLGDLVFYYVFGLFKIAVIVQQIYSRYRSGLTGDPRFARLDVAVASCGVGAVQAIERGRIDRLYD